MSPLRQKLSSGRASLLPVIREDDLAVQPQLHGNLSGRNAVSSPAHSLGMVGGTGEQRSNSEDGGRHKCNRLQQRSRKRKNVVYSSVMLIFWDLGNSFKTPWATERRDDWFGRKKVPGILTLHVLFFASCGEEICVSAVNFISLTSDLEASVSVTWQQLTMVLWEL